MRCPTCRKEFYPQPDQIRGYWTDADPDSEEAISFLVQQCPACYETIVIRQLGRGTNTGSSVYVTTVHRESVIYPPETATAIAPEVPDSYRNDLQEAQAALAYSAKASAALSRRLLQRTLREQLGIQRRDLSVEIEEFISSSGAPSYLTDAIDAVRQIGNFAAHPLKNTNSGEIVDVEPGEAEWIVQALEALFDYVFVQPERLKQRREALNQKLGELGKPPLKGSRPSGG